MTKNKKYIHNKNVNKKSDIKRKSVNFDLLLIFAFCAGLVLIVTTYAWFSSSLNATVDFVNLTVNRETGLYASLDGHEYGSELTVTENIVTNLMDSSYPTHTNTWVKDGLIPISTAGIPHNNSQTFDFYYNQRLDYNDFNLERRYLDAEVYELDGYNFAFTNAYLSFDVFLKNVSNTPLPDNLFLYEGTNAYLNEGAKHEMPGLFNSLRIGIVYIGHTDDVDASAEEVQAISCNNNCESFIYEPNSTDHSPTSIQRANRLGIEMIDGIYLPTYAVTAEGTNLLHDSGHGTIPLDTEHFVRQDTITDLDESLFEISHGITKIRVFIWLEGQDLDSLETTSSGADLNIAINFHKDLAGYENL